MWQLKIVFHKIFFLFIFLTIYLINIAPVQAKVTFQGGFENTIFQYPTTINNWHDSKPGLTNSDWQSRLSRVNYPVRSGNWALKAIVKPGDNYGSSGERAEVYWMYGASGNHLVENEASGTQFYTASIYLPSDFVAPHNSLHPKSDSAWGIFQQLHGADVFSAPPIFAIGATNNFYIQMWSGNLDYLNDPTRSHTKKYSLGSLHRGKWVDFVWKIKYAKNNTGSLDVWSRTEGENEFDLVLSISGVPTLQYKTSVQGGAILDAYWRSGYYTSEETFTRTIYLDSQTRGDNFDEVISSAFPNPSPSPSNKNKAGDLNLDSKVDLFDFNLLISKFGNPYTILDFNAIVSNYDR